MASKAKTTVTFHSGVMTIGGTVIEVAYENAHVFFDFGTEFRPEIPLPNQDLETLLEYRLIPQLPGLYDSKLAGSQHDEENFINTAVFISHVHLDHTKMINYLDAKIPLYALDATAKILPLLNRNGTFLLPASGHENNFTRDIIGVAPQTEISVGEISVKLVPVDHDAYGACGLIITTPTAKLAYTGDLRLHGLQPENVWDFCQQAYHTDCLMIEGVSISFPERAEKSLSVCDSETELVERMARLVKNNPDRPITFNAYPANPLRFLEMAKKISRTTVLTADMAALLKELLQKDEHYYLNPGQITPSTLDPALEVAYDCLLKEPEKYFWQVTQDFENLLNNTLYIHSDAEPLGDFDPAYAKFIDLLEKLGIEFVRLSCSGHATPGDLNKIVSAIEPKLLVPIHSLHPEKLENPFGERILPVRGQKIHF
ncbi:MBL fold metallo-hydrolase [Enterococcus timonensis]|uniref:MBL fold metallo-hydrolase n=1 Tax=Enterococcus timonensis TaxID=1852364 RepID=UPI0008DA90E6|nr:MBL fold metallo-hydrolase [Enterococcus timonensis]